MAKKRSVETKDLVAEFVEEIENDIKTTEAPKQKTKKIVASVNYVNGDETSVSYLVNGVSYGMFLSGTYHGQVEIEYVNEFVTKNIREVIQL